MCLVQAQFCFQSWQRSTVRIVSKDSPAGTGIENPCLAGSIYKIRVNKLISPNSVSRRQEAEHVHDLMHRTGDSLYLYLIRNIT